MKITLKEWKELEAKAKAAYDAVQSFLNRATELAIDHSRAGNDVESVFLMDRIAAQLDDAISHIPHFNSLHPQSEWTGGDSDDPKNHKLREPNIVGLPQRRFTPEEIAEAKAVCHGPVQWSFGDNR